MQQILNSNKFVKIKTITAIFVKLYELMSSDPLLRVIVAYKF